MKVKETIKGDVAILTISGNMMGGLETAQLHEAVKALAEKKIVKIVVDLSDVKWMNSSGIGTLMACYSTLGTHNGKIRLAGVSEKIESLLVVTKLMNLFETAPTVEKAVAGF